MTKIKKKPILKDGKIIGYEAPEKGIKIVVCQKSEADPIIIANHYSHKVTRNSFLSFLVYHYGKVSGALQLGYGINPRKKGIYNPDEVREKQIQQKEKELGITPSTQEEPQCSQFYHIPLIKYNEINDQGCRYGKLKNISS